MFAPETVSVGTARRFVADAVIKLGCGDADWPLVLIVSELATNAVIHARTDFTVSVSVVGTRIRLEVRDLSSRLPRQRSYGRDATTGRGLRLAASMSDEWGVREEADGKTVWVEIDTEAVRGNGDEESLLATLSDADGDSRALDAAAGGLSALIRAAA